MTSDQQSHLGFFLLSILPILIVGIPIIISADIISRKEKLTIVSILLLVVSLISLDFYNTPW